MKEFGLYLKQAREHAGLTLEDMHARTRISMKNLRLIESGDFPSIPQTYVRAFVREYARNAGIDEDETLNEYNEAAEREKGIPRPPAAIDSSNLLPKVDDTVEFIPASERSSSHVEIEGKAEVEKEDFIPPVRKSTYVTKDDAEAIDIRTSTQTDPGDASSTTSAQSGEREQPPTTRKEGTPPDAPSGPLAEGTEHQRDSRDRNARTPGTAADSPPDASKARDTSTPPPVQQAGTTASPSAASVKAEKRSVSGAAGDAAPSAPAKAAMRPSAAAAGKIDAQRKGDAGKEATPPSRPVPPLPVTTAQTNVSLA
jgi:transcriptional regulator with XRE-family HTH domain